MEDSIIFLLLIQVILIALNAVFASAEIAVLSTNETKLAKMTEDGNKKAVRLNRLISEYTGQPLSVVEQDTERDNYMTAQQAKEYGLIDAIITKH